MPQNRPDNRQQARRRIQDFFVLTIGGMSVLALLFLTGTLGLLESIIGAVVMGAGAMAYYAGSSPSPSSQGPAPILTSGKIADPVADQSEFGAFLMSLPFAVLSIASNGRIDIVNAHARRILRTEQAVGTMASAILRQPDLIAAVERIRQNGAGELVEFTLHGDAEVWMAHMQAGPVSGSVLIVFEDLTAVRRAERARADFLANASHELRTPLTAIGGFIETMKGPARDDKASWDGFLEIMHQQTDRMKRLIADLLSLSRIEFSEHRAPSTKIELINLIQKATLSLQPLAKDASVRLKLDTPQEEALATADADEMTQVVQNLTSNAIKYAGPKGKVKILVGLAPTMAEAALASSRQMPDAKRAVLLDPYASSTVPALWLRITDTGPGIPEQHLPRLGERFYRVDESRGGKIEGTGLGLAIVKHIMARHRGGLAVESIEGKGTAFGVWLPRDDSDA